ncbi:MAG: polysaccharide lyase [Ferruginibacter sp.]
MTISHNKKYLLLVILLVAVISCRSQVNVYDGFEANKLKNIWTSDRMVKNAFEVQSKIVRSGNNAAKITLRTGDVFEEGVAGTHGSERDELCETKNLWAVEGKAYEYQFSLFLPDSFPIVPTRLVIAQWKQKCPHDSICSDDSPVIAIRYVSGRLYITIQTGSKAETVFQTIEEVRNKWLDFKFRVRFSRLNEGEVNAWLNEKQIISFKGITCYSSKQGYTDKSNFYFKTGLYRNVMPEPMTIYIDEYSKKEIKENEK